MQRPTLVLASSGMDRRPLKAAARAAGMMARTRRWTVCGLVLVFFAMALSLPGYAAADQIMGPNAGAECLLCACAKNFPPALPSFFPCFTVTPVCWGDIDPQEPRASVGPVLPAHPGRSPPTILP